jgi:hypothetical protein
VRLARFDFTAFDEIRSDPSATTSAVLVVLVSSILAGLGSWFWALQTSVSLDSTDIFVKSTVLGSLLQTAVWFFWVYASHWIVTQMFKGNATFTEMVRTMGFGFAPVALTVFIVVAPLAVPRSPSPSASSPSAPPSSSPASPFRPPPTPTPHSR